jgi:putative restriction endonuclease
MTQGEILEAIQNLNVDRNSNYWDSDTRGKAPHKPFLLLSILDGIVLGWINSSRIELSDDLIEAFYRYWETVMGSDRKTTIALPFYHLKSEPFWNLKYRAGEEPLNYSPSLGVLIERVAYAEMDEDLYALMHSPEGRSAIIHSILVTYFDTEYHSLIETIQQDQKAIYSYSDYILAKVAEPFEAYHEGKSVDSRWQKRRVREAGFGLTIRKNYDHRCAICRSKIQTEKGTSLVDGAHIIPWSKSYNDDPRNGLALCKSHHWMFDQYLLTIEPDSYQIMISNWLRNEGEYVENTLSWDGEDLLIPDDQKLVPSEIALKDHFVRFNELK